MVAVVGTVSVPPYAMAGSCVCPAVSVMFAGVTVDKRLAGTSQSAVAPDTGTLAAVAGVCATVLALPDVTEAYAVSPSTFVGFCHTFPVPADTAELGALGPVKLPVKEVAVPFWLV